jgi:hypothetical protein
MNICFNTTILDKIKQDQALYTSAYMRLCNTSQVSFQQENPLPVIESPCSQPKVTEEKFSP